MSQVQFVGEHLAPRPQDVIAAHPDRAELVNLPDDGVRITLKSNPRDVFKILGATIGGALFMGLVGLVIDWQRRAGRLAPDAPLFFMKPWAFYGMGITFSALAGLIAIMRLSGGPERDTIIEAHPGRLKIDRYVCGDHVVREYTSKELDCLYVDAALTVWMPSNSFALSMFIPNDVNIAAAQLLGEIVWGPNVRCLRDAKFAAALHGEAKILVYGGSD